MPTKTLFSKKNALPLKAEYRKENDKKPKRSRIQSIDLLRGMVMVIMALDHVRYYFHYDAFHFNPTDLDVTTAALFFTRWITHFCAPVFVFLAGTSAFLSGYKMADKKHLSGWLVKRGIWLVILELTFVKFAWMFQLDYQTNLLMVIWALGISMIALAALIHLPRYALLTTGLLIVGGHNLLDGVSNVIMPDAIWKILHVEWGEIVIGDVTFITVYPVLSLIGLMILGYCLGQVYHPAFKKDTRIKILFGLGAAITVLFILLRFTNWYGDPSEWEIQNNFWFTLLSFLKTTKYPASLLFICMTIGPSLIVLATTEKARGWLSNRLVIIGRVPMFYYLAHLYLIHLLASLTALASGYTWSDMIVKSIWVNMEPQLQDYGFNLFVVYLVWIVVIALLYPLSEKYNSYKNNNRHKWWLSYL